MVKKVRTLHRGDIFWLDFSEPLGSEPGYRRPAIIVSTDAYNRSKLSTVTVCPLTTNLKLAAIPGNFELEKGDGDVPKACVANVTQIITVNKWQLSEYIGKLPAHLVKKLDYGITSALITSN